VASASIHHPTDIVVSGPRPRVNRLDDYIFLSEQLLCELYGDSRYFVPEHGGDHLAREVTLASPRQLQGRGCWRFLRYLFECPQVIEAIKREPESLVPVIQVSTNPGIVWQVWKKRFRSMLQRVCQRIQTEKRGLIKTASACRVGCCTRALDSSRRNTCSV